jgi:hypothetical protein
MYAPIALELSNELDGGITVVDAPNGIFTIDSRIVDLPVGTYKYDIQFTFPSGVVKTYVAGTMTIKEEITYV